MLKILLIPFIIILVIAVFFISIIGQILRSIFGIKKTNKGRQNNYRQQTNQYTIQSNNRTEDTPLNQKKIIGKDEGEYVDFEEVK